MNPGGPPQANDNVILVQNVVFSTDSRIVIGTGGTQETGIVVNTSVYPGTAAGDGEFLALATPLKYAHGAGETVVGTNGGTAGQWAGVAPGVNLRSYSFQTLGTGANLFDDDLKALLDYEVHEHRRRQHVLREQLPERDLQRSKRCLNSTSVDFDKLVTATDLTIVKAAGNLQSNNQKAATPFHVPPGRRSSTLSSAIPPRRTSSPSVRSTRTAR